LPPPVKKTSTTLSKITLFLGFRDSKMEKFPHGGILNFPHGRGRQAQFTIKSLFKEA